MLRLGLYQLFFLDGVPDHAAVNETVKLARQISHKGIANLVNAVLRRAARSKGQITYPNIQKNPIGHIAARYSHPEWLAKRWIERFGVDETIRLCSINNLRPPLYLRTNSLKTSSDELLKSLESEGAVAAASANLPESIGISEIPISIGELSAYRQGWFQVQDEGSMLISHILDPQPGETIIDTCAAPGGKSTHIAELMKNEGKIWAFDVDEKRLPLVSEACQRLGINIVETVNNDARLLDDYFAANKADRILVDVPCTGLGVLRRQVEARWRRKPEELEIFPKLQYEILATAARHVKSGGILVYCTCTTEPEENQQVIAKFLDEHPEFQIQDALPFLPEKLRTENIVTAEGYLQIYPHLHNMDGFFAARMIAL